MVESYLASPAPAASASAQPATPRSRSWRTCSTTAAPGSCSPTPPTLDQVLALLPGRPYLRIVVTGAGPVRARRRRVLLGPRAAPSHRWPPATTSASTTSAWMLYTSGTTGKPKGVLSTQRNCLWSVAACYAPRARPREDDRVLWPLPLFHSLAHIFCVLGVTAVGASARIMDGISPTRSCGRWRGAAHLPGRRATALPPPDRGRAAATASRATRCARAWPAARCARRRCAARSRRPSASRCWTATAAPRPAARSP